MFCAVGSSEVFANFRISVKDNSKDQSRKILMTRTRFSLRHSGMRRNRSGVSKDDPDVIQIEFGGGAGIAEIEEGMTSAIARFT